jgi:hypothetical protein
VVTSSALSYEKYKTSSGRVAALIAFICFVGCRLGCKRVGEVGMYSEYEFRNRKHYHALLLLALLKVKDAC